MHSGIKAGVGVVALLLTTGAAPGEGRSEDALFSFGEMRELQRLPAESARRTVTDDEVVLYQNMHFYTFTVIEALLAANHTAVTLGGPPLFCAPSAAFRFEDEGDIALLLDRLTGTLLGLITRIGGGEDHYDDRPASEALLLALRAAHPCGVGLETASAQR